MVELVGVAQPIVCCGASSGAGRGCEVAERRMRAALVVVGDPLGDRRSRMVEIVEDRLVQKLVATAMISGPSPGNLDSLQIGPVLITRAE